MPIWAELMVVMIVAYVIGIAIGWAIWGRDDDDGQSAAGSPDAEGKSAVSEG